MTLKVKNKLNDILLHNKQFVLNKEYEQYATTKKPKRKVVILSCMDTRLTELLPKAMSIKNGDAKIIRNAGAIVMHPFGSVMKSILLSIYEFDIEDVIVVGHHDCGVTNIDTDFIMQKVLENGIEERTISILKNSQIDVKKWFEGFESAQEQVKETVNSIKIHPLVPANINIHGLMIDPHTGELEIIVDGYES